MRHSVDLWFLRLYKLLFFATPLIMFHKTSELFEFNKMLFIYVISLSVTYLWLIKSIREHYFRIVRTPLDATVILFFISQLTATVFSIDIHTSFFGYYGRFNGGLLSTISYIILFYGFLTHIFSKEKQEQYKIVESLALISAVASFLVILWGLPGKFGYDLTCLLFTGSLNTACWTSQFDPTVRMFSTLGQPNWLGAYLAIHFFIGIYFLLKNREQQKKLFLCTLYLFLIFSAILFTRSRSALFAVISACSAVSFYFLKIRLVSRKDIALFSIVVLLVPLLLFKTGVSSIDTILSLRLVDKLKSQSVKPMPSSNQSKSSSTVTESFDIRKIVWRGAWQLGLRYPLFGTGVETFAYSYYFVRPPEHNLTSEWDFIYNKAHNEYLNIVATAGFFGLLAYLALLVSVVKIFWDQSHNLPTGEFTILFFAAWCTILTTNFFGFSTSTINIFFYFLPAFILVGKKMPETGISITKKISIDKRKITMTALTTLYMVSLLYFVFYFVADTFYASADSQLQIQESSAATTNLKKALRLRYEHVYEDKLAFALANEVFFTSIAGDDLSKSQIQKQLAAKINESEKYNKKTLKAAPKNILYWKTRAKNHYLFYQVTRDENYFQEAQEALQVAQTLAPSEPKIYYTRTLFYIGKLEQEKAVSVEDKQKIKTEYLPLINKAIDLKRNYRDAYFAKGLLLKKLGNTALANQQFNYILTHIDPQDEEAKEQL